MVLVVQLGSAAGRAQLARSARQCGSPLRLLLLRPLRKVAAAPEPPLGGRYEWDS